LNQRNPPMNRITSAQIVAAYDVAAKVFAATLKARQGADLLRDEHGINVNTAMDFVTQYRMMMSGTMFTRAMSSEALDYFLIRLTVDQGDDTLESALIATWRHISYYEPIAKSRMHKLRGVAVAHQAKLTATPNVDLVQAKFDAAVADSKADSGAERKARLANAGKKPITMRVTSIVYRRYPDVVAEVLARAGGICDGCKSKAPFNRKSTREPYLEVHHKKQLARGGDDTVENAEALCPNCHRHRHHG